MSSPLRYLAALVAAGALVLGGHASDAQTPSRGRARPSTVAPAASAAPEGVVNINTATEDELRRLPGVGPARAAAIISLRQRVQRFRAADDLLRVRGIGRAGMRRLRPYVTLTGDTTLMSRPGRAPHPSAAPAVSTTQSQEAAH